MTSSQLATRFMWMGALLASAAIVVAHTSVLREGGALWRDESNSAAMAAMSLPQMWSHLPFESFPLLSLFALKGFGALFGTSDASLRSYGLVIGVLILCVCWWNAWRMTRTPPVWMLLLFGLSPVGLRYGDAVRGYGLGIVCILLAFAALWQVLRAPRAGSIAWAVAVAIASVQCLYQNAIFLFAMCVAAALVAARRRERRVCATVLGIGALAALSLAPYAGPIARARETLDTSKMNVTLEATLRALASALDQPSHVLLAAWIVAFVSAVALASAAQARAAHRDLALFALATIALALPLYVLFLKTAGFYLFAWHFVVCMAVIAAALDAILASVASPRTRTLLWACALLAAVPTVWQLQSSLRVRQTNVDAIALELERRATNADLIIVSPWYCGVSFSRYYHGRAAWTTLPPMAEISVHRHDLLRAALASSDPIAPVVQRIDATLQAGARVWYVSNSPPPTPARALPPLGPAPLPVSGWGSYVYEFAWANAVIFELQQHARSFERLAPEERAIARYETISAWFAQGWK